MLPDVDTNHGCVSEQRILVRRRRDLKALGGRVHALRHHQNATRGARHIN